jgi:hypothetical protein
MDREAMAQESAIIQQAVQTAANVPPPINLNGMV